MYANSTCLLIQAGHVLGHDVSEYEKLYPRIVSAYQERYLPEGKLLSFGQTLYLAPEETPELRGLKVLRPGLELGQALKGRFEPAHAWALWLKEAASVQEFSPTDPAVERWLRGETVASDAKGWTLFTVGGLSLSWGKASGGILKNHFPKGLRWL